jgi:hypothetical protein
VKKSLAALRDECAVLLQKYVRMKAADHNGYCACWTCGKMEHWKDMQGGHFIERGKTATKLMEENVHPQCRGCNMYGMKKASVVLAYRAAMVDYYGEAFVSELESKANEVTKHSREYLDALKLELKNKIKELS